MEFGAIKDHYACAAVAPADFRWPSEPLPDDIRVVIGRGDESLARQERSLLTSIFPYVADDILGGELPGWRKDTPILLVHDDGTLVAGGYLFAESEVLPDPGNTEMRYAFTRPEWRKAGLMHHLIAVGVQRTDAWGMRRITASTDRAGVSEIFQRLGGELVGVRAKQKPNAVRRLLRGVKQRLTTP